MTIFSEIYGVYFRIAEKVIESGTVTENDIEKMIRKNGFRDSVLFLPSKLIPQKDNSDWGLLRRNDKGELVPVTKDPPVRIFTELQKRWLRAKLYDPKILLFMSDDTIALLEERLCGVKPLYRPGHFRYTDQFSDGDDFSSESYRENFRKILSAVKSREILEISFKSGHDRRIHSFFLPLKIEYSHKNDKFRVYCYSLKNGRIAGSGIINIGRIEELRSAGQYYSEDISMEEYFNGRKCGEPIIVRVTTERNAVERFLMEFAPYEKHTVRDLETGTCTVKLWYDRQDETELLIRLLSFGPTIEIIGPPHFRKQAAERVKRQYELLIK